MDITKMKKKDFLGLPYRKSWDSIEKGKGFVLIPTRRKHDSGFMCMDAVLIDVENNPSCRLSGCSDVIHLNGFFDEAIKNPSWSIDLLPCGYFRLWCKEIIYIDHALSDLCIYSESCAPDYIK